MKRCLRDHSFTKSEVERINFVPVEVDSIWIRDFGPEFQTHSEDGSRAIVDPTYFGTLPRQENCQPLDRGPLAFARSRDDASPTRLAELVHSGKAELDGVAAPEVYRPPFCSRVATSSPTGRGPAFATAWRPTF